MELGWPGVYISQRDIVIATGMENISFEPVVITAVPSSTTREILPGLTTLRLSLTWMFMRAAVTNSPVVQVLGEIQAIDLSPFYCRFVRQSVVSVLFVQIPHRFIWFPIAVELWPSGE